MNSFHRGARGERAWAAHLTEAGYPARRGVQYAGGPDSPDVACPTLGVFHWEVKNQERVNPFAQAASEAGAGKIPVVAMKKNGTPFLVVMHSADFLMLLNAGALAELSEARKAGAENKNARPCDAHLQITKLFLRLTKDECREVLADIRHRHPDFWEVAQ